MHVSTTIDQAVTQARLAAITEATTDLVGLTTADGHLLYLNDAGRRMTGIPRDEDITSLNISDFHPADQLEIIERDAIPTAMAHGAWAGQVRLLSRGGRQMIVSQVLIAHRAPDGQVEFLSTTMRDVTVLTQQREQFEAIYNNVLDMIGITDSHGHFRQTNPAFTQILGYTEAEMKAEPFISFVHPDDRQSTIDIAQKLGMGETTVSFENRQRTKAGDYKWISWTAAGSPDGTIYAIGRDVTALKQEAELRDRLATIVETSEDAIMSIDMQGYVTSWNKGAEQMYGYTPQEAIGQPISMLYVQGAPPEQYMAEIRRGESVERAEAKRRRKDGTIIDEQLTISPIFDRSGKVIGGSKIARDVSYRKQAEAERERLIRQLRETARFKDEFLAVMSHELRTPLNAMLGLLGIVLMGNTLDERETMMVTRARANSERLLNLINNILDISRMESGRLELVLKPLSMRTLVGKLRTDMSVLAEQKGLDFVTSIDETVPETVQIDEDAINKIVTNLVGNAFKFTESGYVNLDMSYSADTLTITVRDTGIGIPAHMHETIFESFRQVDSTSTRTHGGSGLGLSIVHNLCLAMNGTVRVESTPGQGSTFTVNLPVQAQPMPVTA